MNCSIVAGQPRRWSAPLLGRSNVRTGQSGLHHCRHANSSIVTSLLMVALCFLAPACFAVLPTAWHIRDNSADLGFNMRNPEFELGSSTTITIYQGVQKLN